MSDISSNDHPKRIPFWRSQSRPEGQRPAGLCPDCGRCAGQRRRRVYGEPRDRRAADCRQGTSERDRRARARGRHQCGQRQLRRGRGGPARGARHLRRCCADLWLPDRGGVSVVDRDHRRAAAGGEADCRAAGAGRECWAREPSDFSEAAQAILTTDTVEKTAFARLDLKGGDGAAREVRIAAFGKGSGMIHPQLVPHATMLVYVLTDAAIEPAVLDGYLRAAIEVSFNRISVDGDTSTNDTVLLLASGASGVKIGAGDAAFAAALTDVCTSLARQVVADGEGASHVVELRIDGAASDADALRVAKAIAHSPLVKTAWAGCDPNWGRLAAAIGYSGAQDRSGAHRHPLWRAADLPRRRTSGRVRRSRRPRVHQPARVLDLDRPAPGTGIVRVLDDRPDGTNTSTSTRTTQHSPCNLRSPGYERTRRTQRTTNNRGK